MMGDIRKGPLSPFMRRWSSVGTDTVCHLPVCPSIVYVIMPSVSRVYKRSPQIYNMRYTPSNLLQPPLRIPSTVYPIRLVESHLWTAVQCRINSLDTQHERMILVSDFVFPRAEPSS